LVEEKQLTAPDAEPVPEQSGNTQRKDIASDPILIEEVDVMLSDSMMTMRC